MAQRWYLQIAWYDVRRPASFGRSLRDPGVDRARVQSYAPRGSPPASLGFDRNTPAFFLCVLEIEGILMGAGWLLSGAQNDGLISCAALAPGARWPSVRR